MLLFLTTNMAAMACANEQYLRLCSLPCRESLHLKEKGKPAMFWTISLYIISLISDNLKSNFFRQSPPGFYIHTYIFIHIYWLVPTGLFRVNVTVIILNTES